MGLFGRKKEVKAENAPQVKQQIQPTIVEIKKEEESRFSYPEDLMKMNSEQANPTQQQPQDVQKMQIIRPVEQVPMQNVPIQQERQGFAPLFVKIERYKNILQSLSELKTTIALAKNAFAMLDQMEKMKFDNLNLVANAMNKIEKKLAALDAEFLRPSGFQDESDNTYEAESLQGVMSDLHSQIQELKSQMHQVE